MKRSKLLLGISAGVLALVAITAAKVTRFSALDNAYYHGVGSILCTILASLQFYSIPLNSITPQATAGPDSRPPHAPLYTYNNGGPCNHKLYKYGPED
jgi:hypothetical protein